MTGPSSGIYLLVRDPAAINQARGSRSYAAVAHDAGCSASFLCGLATGRQPARVSLARAAAIEDALGVTRGTLFGFPAGVAELLGPYLSAPTTMGGTS